MNPIALSKRRLKKTEFLDNEQKLEMIGIGRKPNNFKEGQTVLYINFIFGDQPCKMEISSTNKNELIDVLGPDPLKWEGQKVKVVGRPTENTEIAGTRLYFFK